MARGPVPPKSSKPVGYGKGGKAFHSVEAFNASKAGHAKQPTKQNQALAAKRRGISQATEHKGPFPVHPMPGHPSGNPVALHGPRTTGNIMPGGAK